MGNGKLKKITFLAVTLTVIANLLSGNNVLAKKLEITEKDVGSIKNGLDLMKLFMNLSISDDKLKSVLNMVIKGGQAGTDVTYGLLVLSSLNEMEFIDMVVSQRYKKEATKYFEGILDEQLNLLAHYRGIGYDIPRILMGKITGPMAALTLNTFEISSKAIQALTAIENLKKVMIYDGLWTYFDFRRGNESHEEAWGFAKIKMGGADQPTSFLKSSIKKGNNYQSEQQFAALYDKWGPYTDEKGVKKEFKKQVNDELKNTIVSAVEDYKDKLAEKEASRISFWGTLKNTLARLAEKVEKAGNRLKEEFVRINNKVKQLAGFGGAQISQVSNETLGRINVAEESTAVDETMTEDLIVDEIKELEKKVEEAPVISEVLSVDEPEIEEAAEIKIEEVIKKESVELATTTEIIEPEIAKKEESAPAQCQKQANVQPLRSSLIFSEIAWMGSQNSGNDEWMKIKNISGAEISIAGWQILDKDQQIKIVLGGGRILAQGAFLLERTNDDSLPGEKADLIYTGALNDVDEELFVFDDKCQLQDEVLANPDWPGGEKASRQAMKRNSDFTWQKVEPAVIFNYGTPSGYVLPDPAPPAPIKVLISEVRISPIGERFVELYNPNDQSVNLTDWYIQRKTQTGDSWNSFVSSGHFTGKTVEAGSHFLISSSSQADIALNLTLTEGNSLVLKNSSQEMIDKLGWGSAQEFESSPTGNPSAGNSVGRKWSTSTQSYLDTDDNQADFEAQTPTPGSQNQALDQVSSSNQAPSAFFVYTPANPQTNQEVVFDAASSTDSDGTIANFIWNFGDNSSTTAVLATTSHSFISAGDFLISLQAIDNSGATSSIATTTISVSQAPETPALSVVINEIAWAGTKAGSSDEWLELYNNSSSSIDIAGWSLASVDGTPSIAFSTSTGTTTIPSGGYFLLERTSSSTTNVSEDYVFTGALNNEGEKLELRDVGNNLIDLVDFSSGWPAGSSTPSYISMERISATTSGTSSSNWLRNNSLVRSGLDAQGNKINGTPRDLNSVSASSTTISSLAELFGEFSEITLAYQGSPYVIQNNLTVPASNTLKIEPKTVLRFNSAKKIEVAGRLEAVGGAEESNKITFTANSDSPSKGFWQGILFSNAAGSKMENTMIRYGKIAVELRSGNQLVKNNIFENNETPVLLYSDASTTFSGNQAQNNNINGILTDTGTITADAVWQSDANFPYIIDYTKAVAREITLTLKEGTVLKIKPQTGTNWSGYFDINGRLAAEGTAANPVVITSFRDDGYGGDTNNDGTSTLPVAGSWRYLGFNSLTATSTLDNLILRYGSGNCSQGVCWGAITQSRGSGIEIRNSTIEKNIWGIFSNESSSDCLLVFSRISLENTVFVNNERNIHLGGGNECTP